MLGRAGLALHHGRFTLRSRIGKGGAGEVWEADDARDGRVVAVKLLPGDAGGVAAAEREAEVAVRLQHPNVVRVLLTFEDEGLAAIVMERCAESAADRVAREGPMTPAQAGIVMSSVLEALAAAHASGVVHRDVKPANVLLRHDGSVALADWGIARALLGSGATHTTSVALLGTLPYLAPELRQDPRAARPASDLYAAGATLAWLVTGEPPGDPFVAEGEARLRERLPPGLADVVTRACTYTPEARFLTARAMQETLVTADLTTPVPAAGDGRYGKGVAPSRPRIQRVKPTRAFLLAGGALVLAALGAQVGWGSNAAMNMSDIATTDALPTCGSAPARFVEERVIAPIESLAASVGDLDGDGRLDLVFSNQGGESLTIWWSQPEGLPTTREELGVGRVSGRVGLLDVDEDGKVDLVVPRQDAGTFGVLQNRGERRFGDSVDMQQGPAPRDAWGVGPGLLAFASMEGVYVREVRRGAWGSGKPVAGSEAPIVVARWRGAPWASAVVGRAWRFHRLGTRPEDAATGSWPSQVRDVVRVAPWLEHGDAVAWAAQAGRQIVRVVPDDEEPACLLATWSGGDLQAVADLDADGVVDLVATSTCAGCTSNQIVARGVR